MALLGSLLFISFTLGLVFGISIFLAIRGCRKGQKLAAHEPINLLGYVFTPVSVWLLYLAFFSFGGGGVVQPHPLGLSPLAQELRFSITLHLSFCAAVLALRTGNLITQIVAGVPTALAGAYLMIVVYFTLGSQSFPASFKTPM